jgi:hypothetical protein
MLAALEAPTHVAQDRNAGELDVDVREGDERCGGHGPLVPAAKTARVYPELD